MSANTKPIFPATIAIGGHKFVNSDSTSLQTLLTGGTDGTVVDDIIVTNTDSTNSYDFQLWINDGTDDYLLCTVEIPASAGNTTSVEPVSVLSDDNGENVIEKIDSLRLVSGTWTLKGKVTSAVATGQTVYAVAFGGNY